MAWKVELLCASCRRPIETPSGPAVLSIPFEEAGKFYPRDLRDRAAVDTVTHLKQTAEGLPNKSGPEGGLFAAVSALLTWAQKYPAGRWKVTQ